MSSSPTFQHTSPLVPKKALAHQNGHQNGHDSYDATPPSTPPAPCRSSPPLNRNAKPGVWNLRLKSRSSLFNHISVTSQPNTHSEYLSLSGQDTANSASALEVDKLKELCQTEYESRQVSAIRTPMREPSHAEFTAEKGYGGARNHTMLEHDQPAKRSLLPDEDHNSNGDSMKRKKARADISSRVPPCEDFKAPAHEPSLSDAIIQLESGKTLLDIARVQLDAAYATYLEANRSAQLAKEMLREASEDMARVQNALAKRGFAGLPARPAHVWDESLLVAQKVAIVGLETARTLAYGTCACFNPECTLPKEVREYMISQNLL